MARSRLDLPTTSGSATLEAALIAVDPGAAIEEIVARIRAAGSSYVELLVPNDTRALQSVAGCELLGIAAAEARVQLTLFTADEKTLAAAKVARLDAVPVENAVTPPNGITWTPFQTEAIPARASAQRDLPDPAPSPVRPPSEQDFLSGLQEFDQAHAPAEAPDEGTLPTEEGAILFDASGDLGARRPAARLRDAWESAFDELGTTMAAEPVQPARPSAARHQRRAPEEAGRIGGREALFGSLARVFPRREPGKRAQERPSSQSRRTTVTPTSDPAAQGARGAGFPMWLLALATLAVVAAVGWLAVSRFDWGFARKELLLTPPAPPNEAKQYDDLTIALSEQPITDQSSFAIQGAILAQPVSVVVQGEAISTTTAPIGLASGALILRNTISQPLLIRAGTVVPAANGVQFTVDADVTVAAAAATADGITFGRGQVNLTATVPGAAGNIPPGSITAIPGYEGTLRVEQGEFTGGSDQEVRVVRIEDVNRELPRAMSQLYEAGVQDLTRAAQGRPGLALVGDAVRPTVESLQQLDGVEYAVFPPIGGVATEGTFTLEVRATFSGIAQADPNTFEAEITRATRNMLVNTGQELPDARIEVQDWSVSDQGLVVDATAYPPGIAPPLAEELLLEVETALAGATESEARAYLESLVEEGRIAGYSELPVEDGSVVSRLDVRQAAP